MNRVDERSGVNEPPFSAQPRSQTAVSSRPGNAQLTASSSPDPHITPEWLELPLAQQRSHSDGPRAARQRLSFDATLVSSHCPASYADALNEIHVRAGAQRRVHPEFATSRDHWCCFDIIDHNDQVRNSNSRKANALLTTS
jgi:hypothetical protein